MKRIIVLLLFTFCFFCDSRAQSLSTKVVRIEIDGKENKKDYRVFFLSNGKWIEAEKTSTGFIVPNELKNEERLAVSITFGKYKVVFPEIHISKFTSDWIIGVDNKPFSEEFFNPKEVKTIKRVYYIEFLGGLATRLLIVESKNK
jgi:hypothetical protein